MKTRIFCVLTAFFALLGCTKFTPELPDGKLAEKQSGKLLSDHISTTPLTIHTPADPDYTDYYPRVTELPDGDLLAYFVYKVANNTGTDNVVKIYRSSDQGGSWTRVSDLADTHRGLGANDPQIFVVPATLGTVPTGTLILGIRAMHFLSQNYIDLYRSDDEGVTWTYMSTVADGNGWQANVYEPFFILDASGRLLCYYADERDSINHSQKLVYRASTDGGYTWGPQVDVVALPDQSARPGMPQIARMGNNQFMLVYEYAWHPTPGIVSPVHYKLSSDGANWGSAADPGTMLTAADGTGPGGSPTIMWTPGGSSQGTVLVTGGRNNPLSPRGGDNFVNYNYGQGDWYRVQQPLTYTSGTAGAGYSRSVTPSADGSILYHINAVNINNDQSETRFAAAPADLTPGHVYKLLNKNSNMMLGIIDGSDEELAKAAQGNEDYQAHQEWTVTPEGDYVKLINQHSGLALDIAYGATWNGVHAIQYPSSSATSQLWEPIPDGNGFYKLKNVHTEKLLRVIDCSTSDGTIADQWEDNGTDCQLWQLQHIE